MCFGRPLTSALMFERCISARLAIIYAILIPPLYLLVLLGMMAAEADYIFLRRLLFFGSGG